MKKTAYIICAVVLGIALVISGCAMKSKDDDYLQRYGMYDSETSDQSGGAKENAAGNPIPQGQMIITSSAMELETEEYDKTNAALKTAVSAAGGFIFESDIEGRSMDSEDMRIAEFVFKVPKDKLNSFKQDVAKAGNLIKDAVTSEDITAKYKDTQLSLDSKKAYRQSLVALYAKATKLEDMILLNEKIAAVDRDIESLTGQIKDWESRVEYSHVHVIVYEVQDLTQRAEDPKTFWGKVGKTFRDSCAALLDVLKGILHAIVAAVPFLIVAAVIAVPVIMLAKASSRRRKAEREARIKANLGKE